jgi:hypothetical protein
MTPDLQKYYEEDSFKLEFTEIETIGKSCCLCFEKKPFSDFLKNIRYKDGHYKHCKKCHYEVYGRDAHYRRSYGVSQNQYNQMVLQQNNKCKVCESQAGEGQFARLVVDHCHKNKEFRGLICQSCNMALGNAKDNPEILRKLADYLDDYYDPRT